MERVNNTMVFISVEPNKPDGKETCLDEKTIVGCIMESRKIPCDKSLSFCRTVIITETPEKT